VFLNPSSPALQSFPDRCRENGQKKATQPSVAVIATGNFGAAQKVLAFGQVRPCRASADSPAHIALH
jgi:hypothetical protein